MNRQNARCVSTRGYVFDGGCTICGATFRARWGTPDDVKTWVRLWQAFVWRHEGCDPVPLPVEDEAWLRRALGP